MLDKIREKIYDKRKEFGLLLVFIFILSFIFFFPKLSERDKYNLYTGIGIFNLPHSSFPSLFDLNKSFNLEGFSPTAKYYFDELFGYIGGAIYSHTEFHFFNDTNGGMTGPRLVLYDDFNPSKSYQGTIIIHHFYILAQYEISILKKVNDTWKIADTASEWLSPNETLLFVGVQDELAKTNAQYSLEIYPHPPQLEFQWLDLGELLIGGSSNSSIRGYNTISISYSNDQAKESYEGINIIYKGELAVKKLKRFIIMDQVIWKVHKEGSRKWQDIFSRTIYLGNNLVEGDYGFENKSGILLTPICT